MTRIARAIFGGEEERAESRGGSGQLRGVTQGQAGSGHRQPYRHVIDVYLRLRAEVGAACRALSASVVAKRQRRRRRRRNISKTAAAKVAAAAGRQQG